MDESKEIDSMPVTWVCRFHPTDWFHEIGCPHKTWTREQLLDALIAKKKFDTWRLKQDELAGKDKPPDLYLGED